MSALPRLDRVELVCQKCGHVQARLPRGVAMAMCLGLAAVDAPCVCVACEATDSFSVRRAPATATTITLDSRLGMLHPTSRPA